MFMKKKNIYLGLLSVIVLFFAAGCLTTSPVVPAANTTFAAAAVDATAPFPGFKIYDDAVFEYNEKGQLVREVFSITKGTADLVTNIYEYNNDGIVIKKSVYNSKHNLDDYEIYELDSQGRRVKENEYRQDGSLKNYKTYEYKDDTIIKRFFDPKGNLYRYTIKKMDKAGNLIGDYDYRK